MSAGGVGRWRSRALGFAKFERLGTALRKEPIPGRIAPQPAAPEAMIEYLGDVEQAFATPHDVPQTLPDPAL